MFLALSTLYVFTPSGLGLLIATFSRNMAQADMLIILLIALMILLSGAWTPPEAIPEVMRWLMMVSPLHFFIDLGYGVLLKGATISTLAPQILGMSVPGGINFALVLWRCRQQFA